jgi:hypothetical protein
VLKPLRIRVIVFSLMAFVLLVVGMLFLFGLDGIVSVLIVLWRILSEHVVIRWY